MLTTILSGILRALHPFVPFITEEIWQRWCPAKGPCAKQDFPQADTNRFDAVAEEEIATLQSVIGAVRSLRADLGVNPGQRLEVTISSANEIALKLLGEHVSAFRSLAWTPQVTLQTAGERPSGTVSTLIGDVEIFLHIAGAVDIPAELARIDKQLDKAHKDIEKGRIKLSSENFVAKAPEHIVEKERAQLADLEELIIKLQAQRSALEAAG